MGLSKHLYLTIIMTIYFHHLLLTVFVIVFLFHFCFYIKHTNSIRFNISLYLIKTNHIKKK